MAQILLIGLGAGAASALLFATIISGNPLSVILFYLSALPVMLAGIAWSHPAALVAVLVGGSALGVSLNGWIALVYLATVALPAYVLSYMAMLGRPVAAANGNAAPAMEWYPPGRIVMWAAFIGAALAITAVIQFGGTLENYKTSVREVFERVLKMQARVPADQPLKLPGIDNPEQLLDVLVAIMPASAAILSLLNNLVNLWLAGLIARTSGRLRRSWPELSTISYPALVPIVFAAALGVSFISGLAGFAAAIVIAVLIVAYAIAGFAILHWITRNVSGRTWILAGIWLAVMVFGWPLLFVAILGMTDPIFNLRARFGKAPPAPPVQPR